MSAAYDYLVTLRDALSVIDGVKSCKIGIERGIGSKDAPFVRVVPVSVSPDGNSSKMRVQVVFGFDSKNRDYEELHRQYFDMADSIIDIAHENYAEWQQTVTDEDTVQNLKTAVIEFMVEEC